MAQTKRPFRLPNYPKYNPQVEGYGGPQQWKSAFRERMGLDEAKVYLHNDSPFGVLGLAERPRPSWSEVRAAYRSAMRQNHPDLNPQDVAGATERSKKINAAYTVLEHQYGKS